MTYQPALFPGMEPEAEMPAPVPPAAAKYVGGWPFGDLSMFGYDLLLADPAWDFENWSDKGTLKGADSHYKPMRLVDIKALPVGQLARGDCLLLLWVPACMLDQGLDTARAWGFRFKTEIIWRKVTRNGRVRMGTGYRARTMHESLLLCTLGAPQHKPFYSLFDGIAREHSRKPEAFFHMIDKCCPRLLDRAELFARQRRPGWAAWGNETGKFNQQEAT